MTEEQITEFRSQFKSIVYLKGEITSCNQKIAALTHYDRNDSHKAAILRALSKKEEIKAKYEAALQGNTYEWWQKRSKRLSVILYNVKRSRTARLKWENELVKF
jgi:hypothetical protein